MFGRERLILGDEFALHDQLAARLTAGGVAFAREVRLGPRKRPDFMIARIAIEVKVQGGQMEILRQLKRYADDPAISGVVLVTTRPVSVPPTLGGKAIAQVSLWKNLL